MRRLFFALVVMGSLTSRASSSTTAGYYVEYYRDDLFMGLAYHRVGCLTDGHTIQSNQDYDGFTSKRYCYQGASSLSVPSGEWFDFQYLAPLLSTARSRLDDCGGRANTRYGTYNYNPSSIKCSYDVTKNCNSDCWIRYFSTCAGKKVATLSPCVGYTYP